jgi:uncharacterized protein
LGDARACRLGRDPRRGDSGRPVTTVLVAHSLGCIAIAHWAAEYKHGGAGRVLAALLVAPADVDAPTARQAVHGFRPVPLGPLPFSSVVVASRTDPYLSFERATELAQAWGSSLVDAGDAGHLNTDAGYGPWPEGERIAPSGLRLMRSAGG